MRLLRCLLLVMLSQAPLVMRADVDEDHKIEEIAAQTYNFRVVLEKQVVVKVENGAVTLTGAVLDQEQRALAEATAQSLPGVTHVKNELVIATPPADAPDGWIALKIRSILLQRANVSADQTEVSVRDGRVTLTGTADSLEQKQLTEACAREAPGVKMVQNQLIVVAPSIQAAESGAAKRPAERIDDTSITAQVKQALASGHLTNALNATVATHDGVVQLSGAVRSDAERDRVTQLVRLFRGVTSVDNAMTIRAAE